MRIVLESVEGEGGREGGRKEGGGGEGGRRGDTNNNIPSPFLKICRMFSPSKSWLLNTSHRGLILLSITLHLSSLIRVQDRRSHGTYIAVASTGLLESTLLLLCWNTWYKPPLNSTHMRTRKAVALHSLEGTEAQRGVKW